MKTIYLVDDEPHNLHIAHNILSEKYKLKAATNGQKCLQLLEKSPLPDLILLDVMMPEMDGFEVLERIKSELSFAAIPVIMVSGSSCEIDKEKAQTLGAAAFITKPVEPESLKKVISSLI